MAGLWERVRNDIDVDDRINVHLVVAGLEAYFANTQDSSKGVTRIQVKNAINSQLVVPLTTAEETDLNGIADEIDAQSNVNAKQTFLFLIEYAMIAAELDVINETKWRGDLGI